MIGAKSLTSIGVFLFLTCLVFWSGRLEDASRIRDPELLFWISVLACFTGFLMARIGRVDEPSHTSFRIKRRDRRFDTDITQLQYMPGRFTIGEHTDRPPRDLPQWVHRLLYIGSFFWVGLLAFDSRNLAMLEAPPEEKKTPSGFCPAPDAEPEEDAKGPEQMGCALVERAYRLGYATSLGNCGKKSESDKNGRVCELRQFDEPYLHYAWRLLAKGLGSMSGAVSPNAWADTAQELATRFEHVDALYAVQSRSVTAGPRAFHRLWTNLPNPSPTLKDRILDEGPTSEWRRLLDRPKNGSKLFERILGLLLLLPDYKPAAGWEGELTVEWGAPSNVCESLIRDPVGFLARDGTLDQVRALIALVGHKAEVSTILGKSAASAEAQRAAVQRILSFQCWIDDRRGNGQVVERPFTLDGVEFQVAEIRIPPVETDVEGQKKTFQGLAKLLVPTFHYGRLSSKASLTDVEEATPPKGQLYLAQLESLRDVDLFTAPAWLWDRADLLEVYPYHVHMKNFIEVFRRQYTAVRGRI